MSEHTDEQLVALYRGGDKAAGEQLFSRYKNLVLSLARGYFLAGGDTEDLVQAGMWGLYKAIGTYGGDGSFSAYAKACVKNRIIDEVRKFAAAQNSPLNNSKPISEQAYAAYINPEDTLIDSENAAEIRLKIKELLSDMEYSALTLYMEGYSVAEIASALKRTYKQTDNAIARAKGKIRDAKNKRG